MSNEIVGSGIPGESQLTAGISASNSTGGIIASNVITGDVAAGIVLSNQQNTTITGNNVSIAETCVLENTLTDDYNTITNNTLTHCDTIISHKGTHDLIANNPPILSESTNQASQTATQFLIALVPVAAILVALLTKARPKSRRASSGNSLPATKPK